MIFLDTNVLIAAALIYHPHHLSSDARLKKAQVSGFACSIHSLAEMYSNLSSPRRYRVEPLSAIQLVDEISSSATVVTLTARENLQTLRQAAEDGIRGPTLYDALILACARKINASAIFTHNVKHFLQVAPDLARIIREP